MRDSVLNETFLYFNKNNLSSARKRAFERLIMLLMQSNEESVWSTAIECVNQYYRLAREDEFIKEMLVAYADDLKTAPDDSLEFDKKVKVFIKVCNQKISNLSSLIEELLFTSVLQPWQLEVIANTARYYGEKMYEKGVLRMGVSFFSDQYITQTKTPEKGEQMLYTIKQLVKNIKEEYKGMFVTQIMDFIKRYLNDPETHSALLLLGLEVLTEYFEFHVQGEQEYLPVILDNLLPLIADNTVNSKLIFKSLGQFFKVGFL